MKPSQNQVEESELLVLSDGKILAHNITPEMAAILCELDPKNNLMSQRAGIAAVNAPQSRRTAISERT